MAQRRSRAVSPACSATIRRSRRVSCPWCAGRSGNLADIRRGLPVSSSADIDDREEGPAFQAKFDASGLLTCVATDAATGELLMVAHMNEEALRKTIASGEAWYFSRSRNALWRKGEASGQIQHVVEMRTDCDQDAVWLRVDQQGAGACHTGRRSCFYRVVPLGKSGVAALEFRDADKAFDPDLAYKPKL